MNSGINESTEFQDSVFEISIPFFGWSSKTKDSGTFFGLDMVRDGAQRMNSIICLLAMRGPICNSVTHTSGSEGAQELQHYSGILLLQ